MYDGVRKNVTATYGWQARVKLCSSDMTRSGLCYIKFKTGLLSCRRVKEEEQQGSEMQRYKREDRKLVSKLAVCCSPIDSKSMFAVLSLSCYLRIAQGSNQRQRQRRGISDYLQASFGPPAIYLLLLTSALLLLLVLLLRSSSNLPLLRQLLLSLPLILPQEPRSNLIIPLIIIIKLHIRSDIQIPLRSSSPEVTGLGTDIRRVLLERSTERESFFLETKDAEGADDSRDAEMIVVES